MAVEAREEDNREGGIKMEREKSGRETAYSMIYIEACVKKPYRPEQEANYKSYTGTYSPNAHLQTHTAHKTLLSKMINKTTMIERVKHKCGLQLGTSFFRKVSSNKLDGAGFPQRNSLNLQGCSH